MVEKILSSQLYLFYLLGIMIISYIAKREGLFDPIISRIIINVKSNKLGIYLISIITGFLPIPGRVVMSGGILDTLKTRDNEKRKYLGVIDYLATHHYYLWSPLEKTIILPMAVFSIAYVDLIKMLLPLIILYFVYTWIYIYKFVDKDILVDYSFEPISNIRFTSGKVLALLIFAFSIGLLIYGVKPYYSVIPALLYFIYYPIKNRYIIDVIKNINYRALIMLSIVLVIGILAKTYTNEIKDYFTHIGSGSDLIIYAGLLSFVASFFLGSSSRFIALTTTLSGIFGIEYLVFFFALDFSGYLVSLTHKCFIIAKEYFKTSLLTMYEVLIPLTLLLTLLGYYLSILKMGN